MPTTTTSCLLGWLHSRQALQRLVGSSAVMPRMLFSFGLCPGLPATLCVRPRFSKKQTQLLLEKPPIDTVPSFKCLVWPSSIVLCVGEVCIAQWWISSLKCTEAGLCKIRQKVPCKCSKSMKTDITTARGVQLTTFQA